MTIFVLQNGQGYFPCLQLSSCCNSASLFGFKTFLHPSWAKIQGLGKTSNIFSNKSDLQSKLDRHCGHSFFCDILIAQVPQIGWPFLHCFICPQPNCSLENGKKNVEVINKIKTGLLKSPQISFHFFVSKKFRKWFYFFYVHFTGYCGSWNHQNFLTK